MYNKFTLNMYTMTDEPHETVGTGGRSLSFHDKWDKSSSGVFKAARLRMTTLQVQTESHR